MSNDYTPTTDQVRIAYVRAVRNAFLGSTSEHKEEFDRWRNKDRAEAQVEVLREMADELNRLANIKALIEAADKYEGYYAGVRAARQGAELLTRGRADRIARVAGIETGESND